MKKIASRVMDLQYALLASATVALMADQASAQENIGGVAQNLNDQMGNVGKLMVAGSFVGGLVMLGTGLMKLKQAAENQGKNPTYGEGMWRLGVGAGLVAIPAMSGMLGATFGFGDQAAITAGGGSSF